jgi:hypothetical protein
VPHVLGRPNGLSRFFSLEGPNGPSFDMWGAGRPTYVFIFIYLFIYSFLFLVFYFLLFFFYSIFCSFLWTLKNILLHFLFLATIYESIG